VISLGEATAIHAAVQWLRLKRGRALWVAAALYLLPVAGTAVLMGFGHFGASFFDSMMDVYLRFLVPFVPALVASSAVGEELEQKTFTFLFARPAPRSALVLGKFITTFAVLAALTVAGVALVWLLAMARFPEDLGRTAGHFVRTEAAALLGVGVFTALAILVGAWFTRHPFLATMAYLLLIEAGLGSAPIVLDRLAVTWHLRNFAGLPLPELALLSIAVPWWVSGIVPAVVTALCLLLAASSVSGAEYHAK
jgi:ABC-type transport system involved in multi-copper enzyme maturation permease subunit